MLVDCCNRYLEDNLNTFGGLAYGFSTVFVFLLPELKMWSLPGRTAGPKAYGCLNSAGFNHVKSQLELEQIGFQGQASLMPNKTNFLEKAACSS